MSGWLNVLPLSKYHFDLSAQDLRDAIRKRYGYEMLQQPAVCDGCGEPFTVNHALSCKRGGLVTQRHNELRNLLGLIAKEVCPVIQIEPWVVEPIGTHNADLSVQSFWTPQVEALFYISIINADAQTYLDKTSAQTLQHAERKKIRKYDQACRNRRSSFTPFIVTTDGAMGQKATTCIKRLGDVLSQKWGRSYSETISWLRVRFSFAILRATSIVPPRFSDTFAGYWVIGWCSNQGYITRFG